MPTPTNPTNRAEGGHRSQTDIVIQQIKTMITDGRLHAGSRLPVEKDLANELAVSRGSLREGVRALAIMGVLETRQGDGTYVTSLDPTMLLASMGFLVDLQTPANSAHLQYVRRVLETEAAGHAALRVTELELAEATALLASVDTHIADGQDSNHEAIMEADIAFHRIIARAAGNPVLEAMIEALAGRTVRARMWRAISDRGAERETQREHRAILSELVAGDPDRARLRMANHLLGVEAFIDAQASDNPPVTSAH